MITIFYDGKCGLCAREISHYQKIAPQGLFRWQDVMDPSYNADVEGICLTDALKQLHAKDENGRMHVGVDAFVLIWRRLKRWRLLAAFVSAPGVYSLACRLYRRFADARFKRLTHCQFALQEERQHIR